MWIVVEYVDPKMRIPCAWGVPVCWIDKSEMMIYYPINWITLRKMGCAPEPNCKSLKNYNLLLKNK